MMIIHVVYFKLETPQATECIRVDNLHVKLFYKRSPIPHPQWFRHGQNCKLTTKGMLENFPSYIRAEREKLCGIFYELRDIRFKKIPIYSSNLIRYALMLRDT